MRKYFVVNAVILALFLNAETLFEVKDSANNPVLNVSTDGLRVMNEGDTLMVISSDAIRANIGATNKGLSRSFSVTTTSSVKGKGLINALEVNSESASMTSPLGQYTDFSPENIFIGLNSGVNTTPGLPGSRLGKRNIFLGNESGILNQSGYENIMIGDSVGVNNNNGFFNTFIGNTAGYSNTSANRNVFIGFQSGYSNVDKGYNTFVGAYSGRNSTGFENTYIGCLSGTMNSTGNDNTYLGFWSGYSNQSGSHNSIFGSAAGLCNNGGNGNTIMGFLSGAGEVETNNSYNSLFGFKAGYAINTGSNNVMIGSESGYSNTSGTGNVFLGYQSGYNEIASNKLYIANSNTSTPLIKGTFPNTDLTFKASTIILDGTINGNLNTSSFLNNYFRISSTSPGSCGIDLFRSGTSYRDWRIYNTGGNLRIGLSVDDLVTVTDMFQILYSSGYVGIGSTSPSQKLDVYGGNGRVESGYSWLTSSDIRYKTNISAIENPIESIIRMRGVRYDLKEDKDVTLGKGKHLGFIAQELEDVYEELVEEDDNGYKSVAYDKVSAVLVEAIKAQQNDIEILKKEIEELKILIKK